MLLNKAWILDTSVSITNIQNVTRTKKISYKISFYISAIEIGTIQKKLFREEIITLVEFTKQTTIPKSDLIYIFKYHSYQSFGDFKKMIKTIDDIQLLLYPPQCVGRFQQDKRGVFHLPFHLQFGAF